ncbi:YqaJ viral recombinase family protein [Sphingomonas sp.]|uniref:YqaJ viral recombinase family protein n=1 Tax=Sphingomonas sp. TaxID=28214 RepID=UPI003BA8F1F4
MTQHDPALSDAAFRASVVGASEVAALFDLSPWLTHFELWHRKKGSIATPEFNAMRDDGTPENERIYCGVMLEPVIIKMACERWGYEPIDTPKRLDNGKGIGGHPDQLVRCPVRGRGVLEVKTADWLVAKQWGDEPPANYLLQSQTYQGLARVAWGDVIVLVGGNELRRYQYDFRPKLFAEIEARVAAFWQTIADNKPPKPDYSRDGGTLAELFNDPADTLIDLRRDNRMPDLCNEYLAAKEAERAAACRVDAAKAELLEKLGNNAAAMVEGFSVRIPEVAGKPDQVITADMVGKTLPGRKPHRRFYIKMKEI